MDIGSAFKSPTEDKDWIVKVIIGAVLMIVPIANLMSMGYLLEVMKAGAEGRSDLPVWEDWGNKLLKGLMMMVISFIYMVGPGIVVAVLIPMMQASAALAVVLGLFLFVAFLAIAVCMPMVLVHFSVKDSFAAAFEIGVIIDKIKASFGSYMLTILVTIGGFIVLAIAMFIPVLGWIAYFFGAFYLMLVTYIMFGQCYAMSEQK